MRSIILMTNSEKMLEIINFECRKNNIVSFLNESKMNIDMVSGRIYISFDDGIIADYEEDELNMISNLFLDNIYFYLVCYSDIMALMNLIETILFEEIVYIDDDMGNIVPVSEFKENFMYV